MIAGVISRVKIMADLDITEKRVPQDGRVSLTVEKHAIDTRVVTMPRVDGEGIVMRILDKTQALIGLDSNALVVMWWTGAPGDRRKADGASPSR